MKKIEIKGTNEFLYYSKLDNGLEIYMVPKEGLKDFYISFTTKYGSTDNSFVPINKKNIVDMPKGIAHFLEHKMFENEDGIDTFSLFAKTGTYCNAYTNFYNTSYLIDGNNDIEKNLIYLLDFVQKPYFTDENVEKEKGIIEQEIKMYEDRPGRIIYEKLFYNMFINNPVKYSIAGTVKDVYKIKKEDLYECYNTFYNPNNMFLTLSGNFDPNAILTLITDNQKSKEFKDNIDISAKKYNEPNKVEKEYEEISTNVETPNFSVGIKIPLDAFKDVSDVKRDIYTSLIFKYLFGNTSQFNEEIINNGYIDSTLGIETMNVETHNIVLLTGKSKKYKELIQKIKDNLKNINISEEYIERRKKVLISSLIYSFEGIFDSNRTVVEDIVTYNKFEDKIYDEIKSINKKELDKIIEKLNLKNISTFVINSNIKEEI